MSPTTWTGPRVTFLVVSVAIALFAAFHGSFRSMSGEPAPPPPPPPPAREGAAPANEVEPGQVVVLFTDGSSLRLRVLDKNLTLTTPFGKLTVPVTALRRVELATRIPAEVARRVDAAVADLGSADFARREAATTELLRLRERAYPALLEVASQKDVEAAHRAEEILTQIRAAVPAERLEIRKDDVVYTEGSKNTGKIEETSLRVLTTQFGEVQMKLSDVRTIRAPSEELEVTDAKDVLPDPGTLTPHANQVGVILTFRVTGSADGSVWGTDAYTIDSRLATAAVHAGLLKPGQTGLLKVRVLPAVGNFPNSTRNGITTGAWGAYPGYQFVREGRGGRGD